MGKAGLTAALQSLPAEGDSFVVHYGENTYFIPEKYVIIDKLFLDRLQLVADQVALSDDFYGMSADGKDWWLFPFRPELLAYLEQAGLGAALVVTKLDKLGRAAAARALAALQVAVPVVPFSAHSGEGREAVWRVVWRWLDAPPRTGQKGRR
jgi:GTP-binding protein EngB required for normal cell division